MIPDNSAAIKASRDCAVARWEACVAEYAVNAAHEAVVKVKDSGDEEAINSAKEKFQAAYNRSCAANAKYASLGGGDS